MIEHKFDDGSVGVEFELGDIVEVTEDSYNGAGARKGEYGEIFEISNDHWSIVRCRVDFSGYSRSTDTMFCSSDIPKWKLKIYEGDDPIHWKFRK